jgi:hypothetical protein
LWAISNILWGLALLPLPLLLLLLLLLHLHLSRLSFRASFHVFFFSNCFVIFWTLFTVNNSDICRFCSPKCEVADWFYLALPTAYKGELGFQYEGVLSSLLRNRTQAQNYPNYLMVTLNRLFPFRFFSKYAWNRHYQNICKIF